MTLDHSKKHKIAYLYYMENVTHLDIAEQTGVPANTVEWWCGEVINNPNLRSMYLPSSYFKSNKGAFFGKFNGYYENIHEDNIKTDLPKELEYSPKNIDNERCHPIFVEGSFSERINKDTYKIGRELNAVKPVIMQSKINKKEWEKQYLLQKLRS